MIAAILFAAAFAAPAPGKAPCPDKGAAGYDGASPAQDTALPVAAPTPAGGYDGASPAQDTALPVAAPTPAGSYNGAGETAAPTTDEPCVEDTTLPCEDAEPVVETPGYGEETAAPILNSANAVSYVAAAILALAL
jgi:hypothetical protein